MTVAPVTAPVATTATGVPRPPADARTDAAASFERLLLEQLTKQLAATAAPEDASPATAAYRDLLPATMADALSQAGGVGLAAHVAGRPGPSAAATAGTRTDGPGVAGTTPRTTTGSPA